MFERIKEPSTWAGIATAIHAIVGIIATNGGDATAWGALAASVAAIFIPEKKAA